MSERSENPLPPSTSGATYFFSSGNVGVIPNSNQIGYLWVDDLNGSIIPHNDGLWGDVSVQDTPNIRGVAFEHTVVVKEALVCVD